MRGPIRVIYVPVILYPGFYHATQSLKSAEDFAPHFGMTVPADCIPEDLRGYCYVREDTRTGRPITSFRGPLAPVISVRDRSDLTTLFQCAANSNLTKDSLFAGISCRIAVRTYDPQGLSRVPKKLVLCAVEVEMCALLKNYDALCARYFTGA